MVYKREIGNFCVFFFHGIRKKECAMKLMARKLKTSTRLFFHPAVSSGIHCLGNLLKPEVQYVCKNIRRLVWVK